MREKIVVFNECTGPQVNISPVRLCMYGSIFNFKFTCGR